MGFLFVDFIRAGELAARGRLMGGAIVGDCVISSSSPCTLGFLDRANCGERERSGSLYACCRSTSPFSSRMFSMQRNTCFIFISQSKSERIFGRHRLYVGLYVAVITEGLAEGDEMTSSRRGICCCSGLTPFTTNIWLGWGDIVVSMGLNPGGGAHCWGCT